MSTKGLPRDLWGHLNPREPHEMEVIMSESSQACPVATPLVSGGTLTVDQPGEWQPPVAPQPELVKEEAPVEIVFQDLARTRCQT